MTTNLVKQKLEENGTKNGLFGAATSASAMTVNRDNKRDEKASRVPSTSTSSMSSSASVSKCQSATATTAATVGLPQQPNSSTGKGRPTLPLTTNAKMTKPRLTGLQNDNAASTATPPGKNAKKAQVEESPLSRIFAATEKFQQTKRRPVDVMVSDNFMDSLLQNADSQPSGSKKPKIVRKKASAVEAEKRVGDTKGRSSSIEELPNGGPSNIKRRRVRFCDEIGQQLAHIRYIELDVNERVNVHKLNNGLLMNREQLKQWDSQQEKAMLQRHGGCAFASLTDPTLMPPGYRPPQASSSSSSAGPSHQNRQKEEDGGWLPRKALTSLSLPMPPGYCPPPAAVTLMDIAALQNGNSEMPKTEASPISPADSSGLEENISSTKVEEPTLFPWKLLPVDDVVNLIEAGERSKAKHIEEARHRTTMRAISLPEITLPMSELQPEEMDEFILSQSSSSHSPKIIPLEMGREFLC